MVRTYILKLTRRTMPFLAVLAAIGLLVAFLPGTSSPSSASGPRTRTANGAVDGGAGASTTSVPGVLAAGSSADVAGGTGGGSGGGGGTAGEAASDVARSGVTCGPGVRQVSWSHYVPYCVPAFHGNNGGGTSHGVTGSTITVTYRMSNSGEAAAVNAAAQGSFPTQQQVLTDLQTYINYFNTQFETYGRKVVIVPFNGQGDWVQELQDQDLQAAQADAVTAYDDNAFADISQAIDVTTEPYAQDLAQQHVISIGGVVSSQQFLEQNAPYVYTVVPTLNDLGNFEGNLICQRMAGLPAAFAGDASFRSQTRAFGIISPETPDYQIAAGIVENDLKSCGAKVNKTVTYALDVPTLANQDTSIVAQMKAAGVTSVVCAICDDVSPLFLTQSADSQSYYPEWVDVDDGDEYGQLYKQDQWAHALGPGEATPVPSTTEAWRVFKLADPGGTPAETIRLAADYGVALQLFDAIEAAGPDLTPATFERGEFSLPPSVPGGDIGPWQFGSGVFSPQAAYPLGFYNPSRQSPINAKAGSWDSCAGSDGAFRPWVPATGYGPVTPTGAGARRMALWVAGIALAWVVAALALPAGLPFGVILLGMVLGGLSSLTAMGLVVVYRSARIINFAQAEIGALSAAVAVVMVTGWHLPYLLVLPVGLAVAVGVGALVDATVVHKLLQAPRLILTVGTIGLAQVLGATEIELPHAFSHLNAFSTFTTPFHLHFIVGPISFNGDDVVALVVVPAVLVGLALFFGRTDAGIAIRAAADSNDRALLLGIPVRRLSRITWMLAAGLSGVGAMLSAPILGANVGAVAGPTALLAPLAAAALAGMESLPLAFAASIGISVFEQAVLWSFPHSSIIDVCLFVVVLAALLLQRRRYSRSDDAGLGGYVALREVRAIPAVLRALPEVKLARRAGAAVLALAVVGVPLALPDAQLTLLAYVAVYGIIAVSLVVLTGWSGQISLGQFAFAGVGAGTTAGLLVHVHLDLFLALAMAAVVGGVAAVLIGIPAARIPGQFLAVATLAFAVPVSTFLLNSNYFPAITPPVMARPVVLGRIDLASATSFFYFCLVALVLARLLARNYRRTRAGRAVIAVRDNRRGAASFSVHPTRVKLAAFAIAGALAGVAGGLNAVGLQGIGFSSYNPEVSLQIFTMVVIGGLGSLSGALLGAAYVELTQWFLHGALQLLATGAGILTVVQLAPGGLSEFVYRARDAALRALARAKGLSVPSLAGAAAFPDESVPLDTATGEGHEVSAAPASTAPGDMAPALARLRGVDASYGQVQVLFGVDIEIAEGEILALLGTNGAGKSTALRVLSGLMAADAGTVEFAGELLGRSSPVDRVRRGIVTVPGGKGVFPSLTVGENLRLAGWTTKHDSGFIAETTERVLALFPALRARLGRRAETLSGGEQQMLALAMGMLCRPRLLLIDELSLGLAPTVVAELLEVVRRLADEGVTVVVVEQSINVATSLAMRAAFMERGQVRFTGRTADLAERGDLARSVFLGRAAVQAAPRATGLPGGRADGGAAFAVVGLARQFGGVAALDGVDISAAPGEIVGIIGANGAGKTTLFDVCSGFLPADRGRVLLGGVDVTGLRADERAAAGLGRVFQDARLFPSMTVTEVVAVACERSVAVRDPFLSMLHTGPVADSEAAVAARVAGLVDEFGLERYRDAFISELSTGTRRVVELACAVAHAPSVLLLDEPSSGIAQRESEALAEVLRALRDRTGATLLVIEHDIPLVSSLADRLVCMHLGAVLSAGTPAAVLADPAVIAAYLGDDEAAIVRSGTPLAGTHRG
jgi:ABC-type branched-subunit amino acid transport system ATPase component/ABC-type branched-subunit amino acid transport system permease subunit